MLGRVARVLSGAGRFGNEAVMSNTAATTARNMIRSALKGVLATHDAATGAPYASMILLATAMDGAPVTLISSLARHTQNLRAASAASLLIDTSNAAGDASSGGRISLMGRLEPTTHAAVSARFLARHPSAAAYASFADFGFWRMNLDSAHMIEGFGRIVPMSSDELRPSGIDFAAFAHVEAGYLRSLQRRWPAVTGVDPDGVDLVEAGSPRRLAFAASVLTAQAAHAAAANRLAEYCAAP